MRLVWLQQWTVLPVIIEDRNMTDENVTNANDIEQARPRLNDKSSSHLANIAPYDIQVHAATSQQQSATGGFAYNMHAQQTRPGRRQSPSTFDMSTVAESLPKYQDSGPPSMHHIEQQRFLAGASFPTQSYSSQTPVNSSGFNTQYINSYHDINAQAYGSILPGQRAPSAGPSPTQQTYPNAPYFSHQQQQFMYYPDHYGQLNPAPYAAGYPTGAAHAYGPASVDMAGRSYQGGYSPGSSMPYPYNNSGQYVRSNAHPVNVKGPSNSGSASVPSTPRGPPRKPRQSGHALWVGNLPSATIVSDLKDHFSRDATKDIESVFLISKSNCAFVNYRTEEACAAAMARFHDSRFQGIRLVCRLRRSSAAASVSGIPTGPAALMPAIVSTQTAFESIAQNREISSQANQAAAAESLRTGGPSTKINDKYFIMKSLTVEDIQLSIRNSIWATQSHNEDSLNKAYETTEYVYLIFSANKSGEYFGFARMASPIDEESSAQLDWAPRGETIIDDPDIPRSIPTAPTEFAPKGRIIDDSARGTIFWEADPEDEDLAHIIDGEVDEPSTKAQAAEAEVEADEAAVTGGEVQTFGKPFRIEWLATTRLPFYRTRGLRNTWNANREVKIARDGTELETSVGRRLVQMFQRDNEASYAAGHPAGRAQ